MSKLKALLFLARCVAYVAWRIILGRRWNIITVDLEDRNDGRTRYTYWFRAEGRYEMSKHRISTAYEGRVRSVPDQAGGP